MKTLLVISALVFGAGSYAADKVYKYELCAKVSPSLREVMKDCDAKTPLSSMPSISCSGETGTSFEVDPATKVVKATFSGDRSVTNESSDAEDRVLQVFEDYPIRGYFAYGSLVVGDLGFGNASLLFSQKQADGLDDSEVALAFFTDQGGNEVLEAIRCQIK